MTQQTINGRHVSDAKKERLMNQIRRLREEANMDERASSNSQNPDAAPVFAAWAIDKREFADDIESLLGS